MQQFNQQQSLWSSKQQNYPPTYYTANLYDYSNLGEYFNGRYGTTGNGIAVHGGSAVSYANVLKHNLN